MKKILSIIMSLLFLFSFSSCRMDAVKDEFYQYDEISAIVDTITQDDFDYLLNEKYIDEIKYSVSYKDDKYFINDKFVCKKPYTLEINDQNTFLYKDNIYSFGIKDEISSNYYLYSFDKEFNVEDTISINLNEILGDISYISYLKLYDGIYLIYKISSNSSHLIRKINLNNFTVDDKYISVDNLSLYNNLSYDKVFQIYNLKESSYIIMCESLYKFSNNQLIKVSEEPAHCFGEINENSWSFYYAVNEYDDKSISIYKISNFEKKKVLSFNSYKTSFNFFASTLSFSNHFIYKNYLVLPITMLCSNNKIVFLGFLFFDINSNDVKIIKCKSIDGDVSFGVCSNDIIYYKFQNKPIIYTIMIEESADN